MQPGSKLAEPTTGWVCALCRYAKDEHPRPMLAGGDVHNYTKSNAEAREDRAVAQAQLARAAEARAAAALRPAAGSAVKYDAGKLRFDLLPPDALAAACEVFAYGARKYAPYNWAGATGEPFAWCRLFAAIMRHLWAWAGRENKDPESGLPHLWHALAALMMLVATIDRGIGSDDRDPTLADPADSQ